MSCVACFQVGCGPPLSTRRLTEGDHGLIAALDALRLAHAGHQRHYRRTPSRAATTWSRYSARCRAFGYPRDFGRQATSAILVLAPSDRLRPLAMALYGIHADRMPLEFLRGAPRVYSVPASEREPKADANRRTSSSFL